MENKKEHLPLFGVGPIIVYGQSIFTALSIILTMIFDGQYIMVNSKAYAEELLTFLH